MTFDNGNYAVQFLTVKYHDGTCITRLQTVKEKDIDFVINECSFNSLEDAEAYADILKMDSESLGLKLQFKVKKLILQKNPENIFKEGNDEI